METLRIRDASSSLSVLRRLLELHAQSLPAYLASARPWVGQPHRQAGELLEQIAHDHEYLVNAIGARILDLGGNPIPSGSFPMEFTDLHDLSASYLISQVLAYQAELESKTQACVAELAADPESQSLAYEAAGMARGHRELVQELLQSAPIG